MSEVKRRDVGGFGVPDLPDEMGFGCPKCDDHELVPLRSSSHDIVALQRRFIKKHMHCGDLETLEKRGGRLYVTARLTKSVNVS